MNVNKIVSLTFTDENGTKKEYNLTSKAGSVLDLVTEQEILEISSLVERQIWKRVSVTKLSRWDSRICEQDAMERIVHTYRKGENIESAVKDYENYFMAKRPTKEEKYGLPKT